MKIHTTYDYRYAGAVLDHPNFRAAKQQLVEILEEAPVPLLNPDEPDPRKGGVKSRHRRGGAGDRYVLFLVNQKRLNLVLDEAFRARGWELQPPIVGRERLGGPETGLKGDYKIGRLQVEAQFGNMARWYTDVFKFQLSYSLDEIDVAVLIVPTQQFANLIDENVAYFERVRRELPWAKMSLTLPIWVLGIEPADFAPIRECYYRAADTLAAQSGRPVIPIDFEHRLREVPPEEAGNS